MDLTFNKEDKNFVAEFEAKADFNLHIERNKGGDILLYVRTQGGGYDIVDDFGVQRHQGVIDYDFTALVYPKWIKIVSEVEPTYAAVVSDGEVTEIKAQSKEIEVTTNGTTEVTPDAGFAYLNSVKVKTNVAQSGEGGGSGTPLSKDIIYLDLSGYTVDNKTSIMNGVALCAKYIDDNGSVVFVSPMLFAQTNLSIWGKMNYYAIGGSLSVRDYEGNIMPLIDAINLSFPDIPRITEEEFYSLDVPEVEE